MKKAKKEPVKKELSRDEELKLIENYWKNQHNLHDILLQNIKKNMPELEKLLEETMDHWVYEDMIYRYYHQSFKVYRIQYATNKIIESLKKVSPHEDKNKLNGYFLNILKDGASNVVFDYEHNKVWEKTCRPFLEAFFHAKFFLEMAIKYGKELNEAPNCLPSGWGAVLYLYDLR